MLALLPFLALALLLPLCRQFTDSWRSAVLAASVVWGIIITAMTEGLSPFGALSFGPLAGLWAAACLGLLVVNVPLIRNGRIPVPAGWSTLPLLSRVLLACTGLIVLTCGLIALIALPNNWDGFVFHMTRVEHWAQNGSVAHYPTHVLKELHRNPWTAFLLLHLRLLSGGDWFANIIQWLAMIGSLAGVSLIARELGGDVRGQVFAVVATVTLPLGILEASSNQTDYTGAYWVVCLVYFLIAIMQATPTVSGRAARPLLAGGSLGLALLTKATAYLHAFPFLIWFALSQRRTGMGGLIRIMSLIVLVAGIVNTGYYLRNVQLFGSVFGPGGSEECQRCQLTNEAVSAPIVVSNVLRNMGSHLGTPSEGLNEMVGTAMAEAHRVMGISINDPRSTWVDIQFSVLPPAFDENVEGNPVHMLVILWTIGLVFLKRKELHGPVRPYVAALVSAFLLLSLVLKWGPTQLRYHLGLFVLWGPVIGLALASLRRPALAALTVFGLLALALPWLLLNSYRPLIGYQTILNTSREDQLFLANAVIPSQASFVKAAAALRSLHCNTVGVIREETDFEYPLWVLLGKATGGTLRLEEVNVTNVSRLASPPGGKRDFQPCAVVTISGRLVQRVSISKSSQSSFRQREWPRGAVGRT